MLRAIPRLRCKSSKRRVPRKASRRISSVQRSPTSSSAPAIEQFWPRYVFPSTVASYNERDSLRCIMQRTKVAAIVSVGVFVASLDLFIVNIAFPDIERDFHGTSLATLSWILNAYAIVFAALLVPAGRWADRAGRKRAFLAGMALFMVASAASAAAPSVEFLIGARAFPAAGAALMLPTSLALLLPEFPPHRRQVAVGIWAATGGAAAAAGPPVGGLLVEGSWRLVFLVNVPLVLAALAVGLKILHESRDPAGARPDAAGAALLAG